MVFMYFVERPETATKEQPKKAVVAHLVSNGFGHIFEDGLMVTSADMVKGPNGRPGTIICVWPFYMKAKDVKPVVYQANEQVWQDVGHGIWLGVQKHLHPRPDELQREDLVQGHMVKMNDGNEWQIPCARRCDGATSLPRVLQMDEEGTVTYKVKSEYQQLVDDAEGLWQGLLERFQAVADEPKEEVRFEISLDDAVMFRMGLTSLAVNYRIGLHEINMLELFDTQGSLIQLAFALVDWPTVEEYYKGQKKKEPDAGTEIEASLASGL